MELISSYYWKDLQKIVIYLDLEDIDYNIIAGGTSINLGFHLFLDKYNKKFSRVKDYLFYVL